MGCDVDQLYPKMEVDEVCEIVLDSIMKSEVKWSEVDYMEGVRYLALNWTQAQSMASDLRDYLPKRRKVKGRRPGVTGPGPMGGMSGDTEQWIFPKVGELPPEVKKRIIANVVSVMVRTMFQNHLYKFGDKAYRQRSGGPIGLRGTCAVARLVMAHFDVLWLARVTGLKLDVWDDMRYMDDGRMVMPSIKCGWRWCEGEVRFSKVWEQEDAKLSPEEVTKRIVGGTLSSIHKCLKFTTESGEEFGDGWLPTLDLKLRVNGSNQIEFAFYEKPTNTNVTIQLRSAMEENAKMRSLSNELVRWFLNTGEEKLSGEAGNLVDRYAEKLMTSELNGGAVDLVHGACHGLAER